MTFFPANQRLSESPYRIKGSFPFHINIPVIETNYPAHRHDYLEMSLVIEGDGYQMINGKKCPMTPGVCSFLLPYQVHELHATSAPLHLYNCMFDPDFLLSGSHGRTGLWSLLFAGEELPPYVLLQGKEQVYLQSIAQMMLEEFENQQLWSKDLIKNKLSEFLIFFDRLRRRELRQGQALLAGEPCSTSIWPIVHYVHNHYREPITLSNVAERFGVHHTRLSTEFVKHVGMNFIPFVHEVRIRHACSLLTSTDISIYNIGLEVGFNSIKTFSRVFRQLKGVAPREYRLRYREE